MAKFTLRPDRNLFSLPHSTTHPIPIFNNSFKHHHHHHHQNLNLLPLKQRSRFKFSCSIKEKEKENLADTTGVLTGLKIDDELEQNGGLVSDSKEKQGFDLNWPPWKNVPQRYKLIGTTSLAFVICNMDKVIQYFLAPNCRNWILNAEWKLHLIYPYYYYYDIYQLTVKKHIAISTAQYCMPYTFWEFKNHCPEKK